MQKLLAIILSLSILLSFNTIMIDAGGGGTPGGSAGGATGGSSPTSKWSYAPRLFIDNDPTHTTNPGYENCYPNDSLSIYFPLLNYKVGTLERGQARPTSHEPSNNGKLYSNLHGRSYLNASKFNIEGVSALANLKAYFNHLQSNSSQNGYYFNRIPASNLQQYAVTAVIDALKSVGSTGYLQRYPLKPDANFTKNENRKYTFIFNTDNLNNNWLDIKRYDNFETVATINVAQFEIPPDDLNESKRYSDAEWIQYTFKMKMMTLVYAAAVNECWNDLGKGNFYDLDQIARYLFSSGYDAGSNREYILCLDNMYDCVSTSGNFAWYSMYEAMRSVTGTEPCTSTISTTKDFLNRSSYVSSSNYRGTGTYYFMANGTKLTAANYVFAAIPDFDASTARCQRLYYIRPLILYDPDGGKTVESNVYMPRFPDQNPSNFQDKQAKWGFITIDSWGRIPPPTTLVQDDTGGHKIIATPSSQTKNKGEAAEVDHYWTAPVELNNKENGPIDQILNNASMVDWGYVKKPWGSSSNYDLQDNRDRTHHKEIEAKTGIALHSVTFKLSEHYAGTDDAIFEPASEEYIFGTSGNKYTVSQDSGFITLNFSEPIIIPANSTKDNLIAIWKNLFDTTDVASQLFFGQSFGTMKIPGDYTWAFDSTDCKLKCSYYGIVRYDTERKRDDRGDVIGGYWVKDCKFGTLPIINSGGNTGYLKPQGNQPITDSYFELDLRMSNSQALIRIEDVEKEDYSWSSTPHAFGEIKELEGPLDVDKTLKRTSEKWNVLAGCPSTKNLYIDVGGTPCVLSFDTTYEKKTITRSYYVPVEEKICDISETGHKHRTSTKPCYKPNDETGYVRAGDVTYAVSYMKLNNVGIAKLTQGTIENPELFVNDKSVLFNGYNIDINTTYNIPEGELYTGFCVGGKYSPLDGEECWTSSANLSTNVYLNKRHQVTYKPCTDNLNRLVSDEFQRVKEDITTFRTSASLSINITISKDGNEIWSVKDLNVIDVDPVVTCSLAEAASSSNPLVLNPDEVFKPKKDAWDPDWFLPIIGYNGMLPNAVTGTDIYGNAISDYRDGDRRNICYKAPIGDSASKVTCATNYNKPLLFGQVSIKPTSLNGLYSFEDIREKQVLEYTACNDINTFKFPASLQLYANISYARPEITNISKQRESLDDDTYYYDNGTDSNKTNYNSLNSIVIHNPVSVQNIQVLDTDDATLPDQRFNKSAYTAPRTYIDYNFKIAIPNKGAFYDEGAGNLSNVLLNATTLKGQGFTGNRIIEKQPRKASQYEESALASKVGAVTPPQDATGTTYVNNLDCSDWIKAKLVRFSHDIIYDKKEFAANTWIVVWDRTSDDDNPLELFEFHIPTYVKDTHDAKVEVAIIATNNHEWSIENIEAIDMEEYNFERDNVYAAKHSAKKTITYDIIGRIGDLALNSTNDPHAINHFWPRSSEWLMKGIAYQPHYTNEVSAEDTHHYYSSAYNIFNQSTSNDIHFNDRWTYVSGMTGSTTSGTNSFFHNAPKYRAGALPVKEIEGINGDKAKIKMGYDLNFSLVTLGDYTVAEDDNNSLEIFPKYSVWDNGAWNDNIALFYKASDSIYKLVYKKGDFIKDLEGFKVTTERAYQLTNSLLDEIDADDVKAASYSKVSPLELQRKFPQNNTISSPVLDVFKAANSSINKTNIGTPAHIQLTYQVMTSIGGNQSAAPSLHSVKIGADALIDEDYENLYNSSNKWYGKLRLPSNAIAVRLDGNGELPRENLKDSIIDFDEENGLLISLRCQTRKSEAGWRLIYDNTAAKNQTNNDNPDIPFAEIDPKNPASTDTSIYLIN